MPEGFPRVHVAQVHLDERNLDREQGVAQRDAGVREAGRVEDDERDVAGRRLVDALDQLGFGVALEAVRWWPNSAASCAMRSWICSSVTWP